MRFCLFPVLALVVLVPVARAAEAITIHQLEQILRANHGRPDAKVASQLAGFSLSQRVRTRQLALWQAQFPGYQTRDELLLLADQSAFEPLPASSISSNQPPDPPDEMSIFNAALKYAKQTIHNLPNFLAIRQTLHFETSVDAVIEAAKSIGDTAPLSFIGQSSAPVTYRDGNEVISDRVTAFDRDGLTTRGEFGPILTIVLSDAKHNSLAWSYWEKDGDKTLAVFRYRVSVENSHYRVDYPEGGFSQCPAYHGEIAIDPGTGEIFRISIISDPVKPLEPAIGISVEYGFVILGGRPYVVPLHAIAFGRARLLGQLRTQSTTVIPVQTFLNDIAFTEYRLFRADIRILNPKESQKLGEDKSMLNTSKPQSH